MGYVPANSGMPVSRPVDEVRVRWETLPKDRRTFVVCSSGFRGHLALRTLKELGFTELVNVTGGFVSLEHEGGFALREVELGRVTNTEAAILSGLQPGEEVALQPPY